VDVYRIQKSDWLPDKIIEGYTSFIWTERFLEPSEFQLKTQLIDSTRISLPEGSLISHRETDEVMLVETHAIGYDSDRVPELTVTGRSLESFLENRILTGDMQVNGLEEVVVNDNDTPNNTADDKNETIDIPSASKWRMLKQYQSASAAALVIWNHVVQVNPVITGANRKRGNATGSEPYVGNTADILPDVIVTLSNVGQEDQREWFLEMGTVHERVLGILTSANLGLRAIRPLTPTPEASVVSFDSEGARIINNVASPDKLRFDIYDGVDRSERQTTRSFVQFNYEAGHINAASYLFTVKGKKNVVLMDSTLTGIRPRANDDVLPDSLRGFNRRVGYKPVEAKMPDRKKGNREGIRAEFIESLNQEARRYIRSQTPHKLFDGTISESAPYKYRKQYFLGDLVTVQAEYGIQFTMKVSEYVRSEDADGESGYPTLTLDI